MEFHLVQLEYNQITYLDFKEHIDYHAEALLQKII